MNNYNINKEELEKNLKYFGAKIQALRKYSDLTVIKLAEILDVPHSSVSRWENGYNYPSFEKLVQLAAFFDVSTDYLLGLSKCQRPFRTESESYMVGYDQVDITSLSEDEKMLIKAMVKVLRSKKSSEKKLI